MKLNASEVRETAVIEAGVTIGTGCFIGHNVVIRSGCVIGNNVVIGHNSVIEEQCIIGDGTRIQALVYLAMGTRIGYKVFVGPGVRTFNDKAILSHGRGQWVCEAPTFEDYTRIGGGCNILPRVTVGKNSMIGAGSTLVHSVTEGQLWYGVPAKFVSKVPREEMLS